MTKIITRPFGKTSDGKQSTAYEMINSNGMSVTVIDFGGSIQSMKFQGANGKTTDIVLGYDDVASYEKGSCYYGGIIGRYANRIREGRFVFNGKEYNVGKNEEHNHVHGVFHKRMFDAALDGDTLVLKYFSPDMEEGYPGNVQVEVRYRLREDDALEINYAATTDAPTVINLTNHCYFNLNGQDGSTVVDHKVMLNCSRFTEYADTFSQTGKIISVDKTPLDFRKEHAMAERIADEYRQLRICNGYDHNFIIDGAEGELKLMGTVKSDRTGIMLEAYTTEPALQFYGGNFMGGERVPTGKNGVYYPFRGGFCMEAQHYPDSVNHPNFPSTVLLPGEVYRQKTVYALKKV